MLLLPPSSAAASWLAVTPVAEQVARSERYLDWRPLGRKSNGLQVKGS